MLEINDRIRIADCGLDQSFGVVGGCGTDDFQARSVHEIHFRVLGMERPAMYDTATGTPNDDRNASSPAIAALRREIRDLVESAGNEIRKLHFSHRAHTHQSSADRGSNNAGLRDRSIDDAPLAKSFKHPGSDFECASVDADILAKDKYTFVLLHFFPNALANRFYVRGEAHAFVTCCALSRLFSLRSFSYLLRAIA